MNEATEAEQSPTLEAVRKLIPEIEARANEIERERRVPADLNEKLMTAGAYRMALPRKYGGVDLEPLQTVRVIEELARADGSTAWTAMVAFGFNVVFGRFSLKVVDTLLASGPALARGALAPLGIAQPAKDGYIVNGRWSFASGTYEHQWVAAGCLVMENGKPQLGPEGRPVYKLALLPKDQVEFLDTWYSVGLCGSDSTDYIIKNSFVPEAFTTDIFVAPSVYDSLLHRLPFMMVTGPTHCAVCLGLAQGAIDDLSELARNKRPAFSPKPPGEDPVFQYRFGELAVRLAAARAYTQNVAQWTAEKAKSGEPCATPDVLRLQTMVAYVHHECVDIIDKAFTLAGSTPVYRSQVLQRRWRDIKCVASHFAGSTACYQALGAALSGTMPALTH
jgi:alkylation response protein AidB-like acyl-CoA dehydrogenase